MQKDRLGSTTQILDGAGTVLHNKSYDAFGKPREADWTDYDLFRSGLYFNEKTIDENGQVNGFTSGTIDISKRGFTDHEHLDALQLIHMNGRMYDYNNGRFLSVDPFIQAPTSTQSLNPYTYIFNNPLSGTDPSGYKSEVDKYGVKNVAPTGSRIKSGKRLTGKNSKGGTAHIEVHNGKVTSAGGFGSIKITGQGVSDKGSQAEVNRGGSNSQGLLGKYKNNDDLIDGYSQSVDTFGVKQGNIKLDDDSSFNFISSGSEGFHNGLVDYLISLNKNKYGRKLLKGLADSVTKIFENFGQNATTERKWYNLSWSGSTVAFDPRDMASPVAFENRNGEPVRGLFNARNILAHELFHAWQNTGYLQSGAISVGGGGIPGEVPSEVSAVRFVNQIRKYNLSQQFRVQYSIGGPRVDSYSEVVKRTTQH